MISVSCVLWQNLELQCEDLIQDECGYQYSYEVL
jgi:hypothetical protein